MNRLPLTIAVLGFAAAVATGPALAAPGDPRAVQGTLEWPANLGNEAFIVVRGDDGQFYYVDIGAAQRRGAGPLTAGARVSAVGVEGGRTHEVAAMAVGPGDAGVAGVTLPPAAGEPAASVPTAMAPEPLWRLDGRMQRISGPNLTMRTEDGRTFTVDVSALSPGTLRAIRPGDQITLFGTPTADQRLVANGFIHSETPAAASPRSPR